MSNKGEIKKITVGLIFGWLFGIIFLWAGIGAIINGSPIPGIVIIVCLAMILPDFNRLIKDHINFEISRGVKILLVIIILIAIGFSANEKTYAIFEYRKTDYMKNYVAIEDVEVGEVGEVGEGYGQFDVNYDKKKPTVQGRIRNNGNETLEIVEITVYFLDSKGIKIGEKQYYPISSVSILGDNTPLKPNYVRDWGYVVDDAPSECSKKVEVVVSDIIFG